MSTRSRFEKINSLMDALFIVKLHKGNHWSLVQIQMILMKTNNLIETRLSANLHFVIGFSYVNKDVVRQRIIRNSGQAKIM